MWQGTSPGAHAAQRDYLGSRSYCPLHPDFPEDTSGQRSSSTTEFSALLTAGGGIFRTPVQPTGQSLEMAALEDL